MTESAWYAAAYCYMAIDAAALIIMSISFAIVRSHDPEYRKFFPGALITIAGAAYFVHAMWLMGDWIPGAYFPWPRLLGDVALSTIAVRRVVQVLKLQARLKAFRQGQESLDLASGRSRQAARRR